LKKQKPKDFLFMSQNNFTFQYSADGCHIYAICQGKKIGDIFFVKIGTDKLMISEAEIEPDYKNNDVEFFLIKQIITMAREQHRKIISICPYISEIFKQHPEFDDVRLLLNQGR